MNLNLIFLMLFIRDNILFFKKLLVKKSNVDDFEMTLIFNFQENFHDFLGHSG